jgi:NAD+ synthase
MFSERVLELDTEAEVDRLVRSIRALVRGALQRRGAVVAISGGVDSALVAALCVRALGSDRVLGLLLPERESSPESLVLGRKVAETFGIAFEIRELSAVLEAFGCYAERDDAIRSVLPEYGPGWRCKLVLPPLEGRGRINLSSVVAVGPTGEERRARLPLGAYLRVVAASNLKQRMRAASAYHHAERLHYAVAGTPNRLEYDQGFFVKGGDGLADLKPIAHLYKTQVRALAEALGVPAEICWRPPTTDTWSLAQSEEEFYFGLPCEKLDLCLWALNHGVPASDVAPVVELAEAVVQRVFEDIVSKRRATRPLHLAPLLVEPVAELDDRIVSGSPTGWVPVPKDRA